MKTYRSLPLLFALAWLFSAQPTLAANDLLLPDLGGASSGLVSPADERELGQAWLRLYRSQVPTSSDPFIRVYLEELLQRLSLYSELDHKDLDLVVAQNPTLNAFAVPGGVIGVNTGVFLFAENEQQLSSILAHELAHLSQRHYARRVEEEKNASIPNMAALLAGMILAATAGGDAGMAAITAVQASSIERQLRFSRQMEQEADRIGMATMVEAGMNPHAMAEMFDQMLRATRYSRRPPAFLLSHPVTESRIADARLRADRYPERQHARDIWFYLVRARVIVAHEGNAQHLVRRFTDELQGASLSREAARYGLVLALTKTNELDEAGKALAPLLDKRPDNPAYIVAAADIEAARQRFDQALPILQDALKRTPNSHPLNLRYAEMLMTAGRYGLGESVLEAHVERRPEDPYVWYLLAEMYGLAGHIFDVHMARTEYFILMGLFDKAEIQLKNALALVDEKDQRTRARIDERLKDVRELRETSRL